MEDYTIHVECYWRDITCVFLKGASGDLHRVSVYPEGFSLHQAVQAGRNRFVVSSHHDNVEGELEVWNLGTATRHTWQLPKSSKTGDTFLWKGDIVFSPDNRYAALCGGERFRQSSIYVVDLDELKLTIMRPNGWTDWDIRMVSIDNNQQFVVSDNGYPTINQWHVDLKNGSVVHKQANKPKRNLRIEEWGAPSSAEASAMFNSMPVKLQEHELPYEIYWMDKLEQCIGEPSRLTARLFEWVRNKFWGK